MEAERPEEQQLQRLWKKLVSYYLKHSHSKVATSWPDCTRHNQQNHSHEHILLVVLHASPHALFGSCQKCVVIKQVCAAACKATLSTIAASTNTMLVWPCFVWCLLQVASTQLLKTTRPCCPWPDPKGLSGAKTEGPAESVVSWGTSQSNAETTCQPTFRCRGQLMAQLQWQMASPSCLLCLLLPAIKRIFHQI